MYTYREKVFKTGAPVHMSEHNLLTADVKCLWHRRKGRMCVHNQIWLTCEHIHCRSKLFIHLLFQLFLKCLNFYNNKLKFFPLS